MADTDGRDRASATKFVSPSTYLISVVNSAIKAKCLVCRSDGPMSLHKLKACDLCSRKKYGLLNYV